MYPVFDGSIKVAGTMLEVKNLTKYFGQSLILKDVNLKINEGEVVQISGPSGAGKTTLLRCIAGLEKFEAGSVTLNDIIVQDQNIFVPPVKRKIGMVFQYLALWPNMTVYQNINFVSSSLIKNKTERKEWNNQLLSRFKIDHKKDSYPAELSGGEQQRVALVRAFANKTQLLLLDEPFSYLDDKLTKDVVETILDLSDQIKFSIVVVTHEVESPPFGDSKKYILINGAIADL